MRFNVRWLEGRELHQVREAITRVGADPAGVKVMSPKGVHRVLMAEGLNPRAANILKQEMLSLGAEAAVHREVVTHRVETTGVVMMASLRQYHRLVPKLKAQPFGLAKLAEEIRQVLQALEPAALRVLHCRGRELILGERTLVMGILNVTPDSFSDGGKYDQVDVAIRHALRMVEEGADIIDVGAESTRPTATPVPAEEEMHRLFPVLERLVPEVPVPVSVDTYKAVVAEGALARGAHIINDVWGLKADSAVAEVCARYQAPLILMHNQQGTHYQDLLGDILRSLRCSIATAEQAGVSREMLVIDPGIGFGKTVQQNLTVMARLGEFRSLGLPILLGTSRKSMIGHTLNLPVDQRVEGTAATVALGIAKGVDIVRVHDVQAMVRVVRMTDAMVRLPADGNW